MGALALRQIEGKYEILDPLREGGMGAVYKVRHRLLDEVRVIKVVRPQLQGEEEFRERFQREARSAIKLRHPNVEQIYDFTIDDDGTAVIVLEFIEGVTLADLLAAGGPPPLGLALEIAQQSLRALAYLHERGFIHRDVAPDNLMLTKDADGDALVKLIDLGLAKPLGGERTQFTQAGMFLGKIRYSAPEQFLSRELDGRADLYSFGVVFYELLTGHHPIPGGTPSAIINGHLKNPPLDFAESDRAGRIPPDLRTVLLTALAKQKEDRFTSAGDFSRRLDRFRSPFDVSSSDLNRVLDARPPTPAEKTVLQQWESVQDRLDQRFTAETRTPVPGSLTEVMTAPQPVLAAPERPEAGEPEVTAAVAGIRAEIERQSWAAAEMLLYVAEAELGQREVFTRLWAEVETGCRQRAGGPPSAAVPSDVARADVARAEVLVGQAEVLLRIDETAAARSKLRQALKLDPESSRAQALLRRLGEA